MKRIKSFTALICILTILLSISACDLKSQITTPEETTTIPTTTTITETTEATTTTETTETETVATTTTETSEETSETTAATKATTKPTSKTSGSSSSSSKPSTTKKTTNKTTATKAPTKKPTTKPVVKPKTSKTPTKKPTPVPSKGYAMVKFKFSVTMRDKDENGNYIKHSFTKDIKCVTTNYHSKKIGDYHACDEDATLKAVKSEVGPNYRNYSGYKVKVVKFLN